MPAKTEKQRRFFASCLHNPKHKGKCPSKSVSKEMLYMKGSKGGTAKAQADGLEEKG